MTRNPYTKFYKSYQILKELEYSNKPELFLHQNKNEDYLTLGGIYEGYHSKNFNFDFVHLIYSACRFDIKRASIMLYADDKTRSEVLSFFKINFWDTCNLDNINSQKICDEIFISAVHIGVKPAIKIAQGIVGVKQDGIIGNITINALNSFNEKKFDIEFDEAEIINYKSKKTWDLYAQGFKNRATIV